MDHIAIDLGGLKSQVCIRTPDSAILREFKVDTPQLEEFLQGLAPSRIIMETCSESVTVAAWAKAAGHDVRVVPATLAPMLGVGARGIKTDERDARALALASCQTELAGVYMRSSLARERQTCLATRAVLVTSRTALINSVKGWMRQSLMRLKAHTSESFAATLTAHARATAKPLPDAIGRQLIALGVLTEQIKAADAELALTAKTDEVCKRLTSVPGVGPTTAVCFAAVVDTPERFATAGQLASYLGLTPGENSSSGHTQRTGITKAGSAMMRQLLVQSAWSIWNRQKDTPIWRWTAAIADRRGRRVAITALARKLALILFALWKNGDTYVSAKAATGRAPTLTWSAREPQRTARASRPM